MSNATIRTAAIVNALIDAINADATASGVPVNGTELNLLQLEANAAKAIEKFEKAAASYEAQAAVRNIEEGDEITYVYGRAHTKSVNVGKVLAVADGKTGLQFNVLTGSGITTRTDLINADAVLLTADAVAAVAVEISEAVAAKAKADADKAEAAKAQ